LILPESTLQTQMMTSQIRSHI